MGIGNQCSGSKARSDVSSVARLGRAVNLPERYSGVLGWLLKVTLKALSGLEYIFSFLVQNNEISSTVFLKTWLQNASGINYCSTV